MFVALLLRESLTKFNLVTWLSLPRCLNVDWVWIGPRTCLTAFKNIIDRLSSLLPLGWISSVHWGSFALRQVIFLHMVQPSSRQTEILQETRETNDVRRRASLQRWVTGSWYLIFSAIRFNIFIPFESEWETRSETEMGLTFTGKAAQRHNARMSRRFRAEHNRQATIDMCAVKSRPEGEDATDWLPTTSR